MRLHRNFYVTLLALAALPLYGQGGIGKQDILGSVTMSGSLIACGYTAEGKMIGLAAAKGFPMVGLTDCMTSAKLAPKALIH